MSGVISAIQFLTAVPIRTKKENLAAAPAWFPLVGLFLGLALIGMYRVFWVLHFERFSISVFLVVLSLFLTGGLHLDGLADTTDALASGKSKEEMLSIMRDSHIGAMGVLSIVCVLLLKISLLSSISSGAMSASLILTMLLSRWSMVFAMFLFPYARAEGKAKILVESTNVKQFVIATIVALACAGAVWRLKGLFVFIAISIATYIFARYISKKLGGMTGDALGATNEVIELSVLFIISVIGKGG